MSNWVKPVGARGTAAMPPEVRVEVARAGGRALSKNRLHMAELGRKGGKTVSANRSYMSEIGRKGVSIPALVRTQFDWSKNEEEYDAIREAVARGLQ